jgi:hypothetical protein
VANIHDSKPAATVQAKRRGVSLRPSDYLPAEGPPDIADVKAFVPKGEHRGLRDRPAAALPSARLGHGSVTLRADHRHTLPCGPSTEVWIVSRLEPTCARCAMR